MIRATPAPLRAYVVAAASIVWLGRSVGAQSAIPNPLTLADAERMLSERSLLAASNRALVNAAEAARRIAGYKPNPVVQFGAEQFPFSSNVPGSAPRFWNTDPNAGAQPTYTVQYSQLFERGDKRELRTSLADANLEVARLQALDSLRLQLFQLRQAFGNALVARDNLRLAQAIDAQYGRTEELTLLKVKTGELAPVESYRARAGRLQFAQAVIDAKSAYEQATRDVMNLLDASPDDQPGGAGPAVLEVSGDLTDTPVARTLVELRTASLQTRPDVLLARQALVAADRSVDLSKAQRSRDLSTTFEFQRVGNDLSLGVITQVPLFVHNDQRAGIDQASAQRASADALLKQAERQARTDVEKAFQAYLAARQSLLLYSGDNIEQVRKLQDIADYSYREGYTSLFEFLDVQRSTSQTLIAYNQARLTYQVSLWQLEQAVGGPIQ